MSFEKSLKKLLGIEKGYSNHSSDSGGETRWGITKTVAREFGYMGPMSSLPLTVAERIYLVKYWRPLNLDAVSALSPKIADEMFDTGVNCGISVAGEFLQASLNVLNRRGSDYEDIDVDGRVGPKTISVLKEYLDFRGKDGKKVLLRVLNCLQGERYISLAESREKDESFVFGWFLHRIEILSDDWDEEADE